jgi:CDP-Glycerol:Poly(glycerophosphate) glycerophosphotransferase
LGWERFILSNKAINAVLSTEPVDLILLGSPGYTALDALLMQAAVHRGIPVAVAVLRWDNLSSKGGINPMPDWLLVSSDHMRTEAVNLHRIPTERIIETGAPLYDAFANSSRFGSRAENLRRLKLDPQRRLIFYGTNHAAFFPDEIEVVKRVAQWVEEDALGEPCQLWIRLHPQAVTGPYKVPMEPYSRLASERVKVEFPPVRHSNLLWDLPRDDLEHLVQLLRDADVVINTASSLSIDAAALDRPTICVAFDPTGDLPYEKSVRRYYDYTHMSMVASAQAARLATSPEDLQQKIVTYLKQPALDRSGRRRIVQQQLGRVDGKSAIRVVEAILEMLPTEASGSMQRRYFKERLPSSA